MKTHTVRMAIVTGMIIPALSGCIASTVYDVATAPVRVAGKAVDLATTSQSEADEKRGRALRRREEQLGRLDRSYQEHARACVGGDETACAQGRAEYARIQSLLPAVPAEPR